MGRSVLIRGARQLLTLHGPRGPRRGESMRQLGLIEDGAVLISGGVITNVGPTRRIENLAEARSAEEISATGRVVMPGFVDAHTQLVAAPPKVLEYGSSPQALDGGLGRNVSQLNSEHIRRTTAHSLEHQARRFLLGSLRHGTTTIEAKSGFGLDESGEIKMLRVLSNLAGSGFNVAPTFLAPHMVAPEFNGTKDEYVHWICDFLLPKVKARKLAKFVDAYCDPTGLTIAQCSSILNSARRAGLATKLHAEHTGRVGAVRMAVEMGAVSVQGLNHINSTDMMTLANSRTVGVIMPGPMHQGYASKFAPARQLIDAGAAVALASGFHPPVSSTYNMMTVMALACTHMDVTPEECITAATVNAAHAVGRAANTGTLEFGKEADLIMLGISDYREIPYNFGVNLVAMTMRKGQVVYREGAVEWNNVES